MAVKEKASLREIGQYKPAKSRESIKRQYGIEHLVKLAGNENRLGCSPKVKEAIEAYISDDEQISLYPDGNATILREKVAAKLKVPGEQIIFGSGSFELISIIAQTYLEIGDESVYCVPTFNWYKNATKQAGGVTVEVPSKDFAADLEAIKKRITDKTKIIWICNPNNPTGTKLDKTDFLEFLDSVDRSILVVLDEAYIEFVEDEDYIRANELIDKYDNLIALRTFSKLHGLAGYRVGYGFACQEIIGNLHKAKLPINVTALSQVAAAAAIDDEEFPRRVLENNKKSLELYYKTLDELGLRYVKSNTNFILFDTGLDSKKVEEEYLKEGILIRPAAEFGLPTWLRVTVGTYEDNVRVLEILKRIVKKGA